MKNAGGMFILFLSLSFCSREKVHESSSETQSIEDVKEIKKRVDGKFDVTCSDGSKEIASKEQILSDNICLIHGTSLVISSGSYVVYEGEHLGTDCKHNVRAFYDASSLKSITLKFSGACSVSDPILNLSCSKNQCSGKNSADEDFTMKLLTNTQYEFKNLKTNKSSKLEYKAMELILFTGPKRDIGEDELSGWRTCHRDTYADTKAISQIQIDCSGKYLLLACKPLNATKFAVAGIAEKSEAYKDTTTDYYTTNQHNGLSFYYNSERSWGFAKGGDGVDKYYTDILSTPNPEDRLSWRVSGGSLISSGRCGSNQSAGADYERVIFTSEDKHL